MYQYWYLEMDSNYKGEALRTFSITALLVLIDLLTKSWAWQFYGQKPIEVFEPILLISPAYNPGMAFGIGSSQTAFLVVSRIVLVIGLMYLASQPRNQDRKPKTVLILALSGAIGNLYDNLSPWLVWQNGPGHVRDFIRVDLGFWIFHPWPTFNIADVYLFVAAAGLFVLRKHFT